MIVLICTFLLVCYIFSRLTCGISKSSTCLVGKTAIVTGGNAGLGYEICLNLASRGCKVIIADISDSNETRKKIIQLTKNPNIISKILDLSSFESVRNFAQEINSTEERLDILVNNAGIGGSTVEQTEDGLNHVMQVNYFGPFLLTHLLIDLLKKAKPSRILFTSSCMAYFGNLHPKTFTSPESSYGFRLSWKHYSNSKLATIMASDIFAEKLKHSGVTCNALHPGIISTNIYNTVYDQKPLESMFLQSIPWIFGKSTWEGAQTAIHLAVAEELENVTGKYFWDCRTFIKPLQTRNRKLCKKIWELSEECVKLTPTEKI